jgi:hypothetical protein
VPCWRSQTRRGSAPRLAGNGARIPSESGGRSPASTKIIPCHQFGDNNCRKLSATSSCLSDSSGCSTARSTLHRLRPLCAGAPCPQAMPPTMRVTSIPSLTSPPWILGIPRSGAQSSFFGSPRAPAASITAASPARLDRQLVRNPQLLLEQMRARQEREIAMRRASELAPGGVWCSDQGRDRALGQCDPRRQHQGRRVKRGCGAAR